MTTTEGHVHGGMARTWGDTTAFLKTALNQKSEPLPSSLCRSRQHTHTHTQTHAHERAPGEGRGPVRGERGRGVRAAGGKGMVEMGGECGHGSVHAASWAE